MSTPLTDRQTDVLRFVRSYVRRHRVPPTIQEIADAFELKSPNAVVKHLRALEKKGYLEREPHQARGLRLVEPERPHTPGEGQVPYLPVLGAASSHRPDRLREKPAAYLAVDPYLLADARLPEECMIGRASDNGMHPEAIKKGDLLLIEEQPLEAVRPGMLAGVLVGDQLLARNTFVRQGHILLRAADPTFQEETFLAGDPGCHVIGRVLSVLRRM